LGNGRWKSGTAHSAEDTAAIALFDRAWPMLADVFHGFRGKTWKKPEGFRVNSRCFSLFFQEFTASGTSSAAEILGFRRFDRRNNSERSTVISLFSLFWAKYKIRDNTDINTMLGRGVWF
jgi:hypothetical protein